MEQTPLPEAQYNLLKIIDRYIDGLDNTLEMFIENRNDYDNHKTVKNLLKQLKVRTLQAGSSHRIGVLYNELEMIKAKYHRIFQGLNKMNTNKTSSELIKQLRNIPTRAERLGGQCYNYVRVEEVVDVVKEFMRVSTEILTLLSALPPATKQKPDSGEEYFTPSLLTSNYADAFSWYDDCVDVKLFETGRIYNDKEDAIKAGEILQEILHIIHAQR